MERFVFSLYGFWFWLTRKYRAARYGEAADTLRAARLYLLNDFSTRASTRDRGYMLSHQVEALALLEQHGAFAMRTSRRFASLNQCCRFIVEELAEQQPAAVAFQPAPVLVMPSEPFFASIARGLAEVATASAASIKSLSSVWTSESAGSIGDLRQARWRMSEAFVSGANRLSRLAPHAAKPQVQ